MDGNRTSLFNSVAYTTEPIEEATTEMKVTVTATGEKMTPEGYVYARFYFEQSYVDSKLVVFRDIKIPLLSIDVAKKVEHC